MVESAPFTVDPKAELGPLPVWGWGIVVGGLAVAYLWFGRATKATAVVAAPVATTVADSSLVDSLYKPSGASNGSGIITLTQGPESNLAWAARTIAALALQGISPIEAQIAVSQYVQGATLTAAQQRIVEKAIAATGLPPEGVSGQVNGGSAFIPVTPPATTGGTATTPPNPVAWVIGKGETAATGTDTHSGNTSSQGIWIVDPGDTLYGISRASGVSEATLMTLNGITNPNLLIAGQTIKLK